MSKLPDYNSLQLTEEEAKALAEIIKRRDEFLKKYEASVHEVFKPMLDRTYEIMKKRGLIPEEKTSETD